MCGTAHLLALLEVVKSPEQSSSHMLSAAPVSDPRGFNCPPCRKTVAVDRRKKTKGGTAVSAIMGLGITWGALTKLRGSYIPEAEQQSCPWREDIPALESANPDSKPTLPLTSCTTSGVLVHIYNHSFVTYSCTVQNSVH